MENIEDISRRIFREIFKLIFGARLVINQETIYIPVSRIQFLFNLVKRTERRLFENSPDHKHLSPPFSWNILNPRTIRSGKKRVGGRPVSNQREREREKPSSLSLSLRKQRVRVPNLSKSAAKFGGMEISVEKYPSPPFHSVGIRRDFSSRSPIFVSPMPMGHDFPRRESVGAEICVYTNESAESRFHGEEGSIGEREREFGTVPFSGSMCHSCVLSGDTGNPAPSISPPELLNRGNRKGNPISREGGEPCAWIEEETTRTTRGKRKRVVVARASQLLENTDLSRSSNRLLFQISIQPSMYA